MTIGVPLLMETTIYGMATTLANNDEVPSAVISARTPCPGAPNQGRTPYHLGSRRSENGRVYQQ